MPTEIQKVRIAVADLDPALPLLDDATYQYFLDKNNANITRASMDAAKTILLMLSQRGSYTVDIFSISGGHKSAEQYRLALELFIKSPDLNPMLQNTQAYFGGVSVSDIQSNDAVLDNNIVQVPAAESTLPRTDYFSV
jgi:hypothetical protein